MVLYPWRCSSRCIGLRTLASCKIARAGMPLTGPFLFKFTAMRRSSIQPTFRERCDSSCAHLHREFVVYDDYIGHSGFALDSILFAVCEQSKRAELEVKRAFGSALYRQCFSDSPNHHQWRAMMHFAVLANVCGIIGCQSNNHECSTGASEPIGDV